MTYRIPFKDENIGRPSKNTLYTVYGVNYCPYCIKSFNILTKLNEIEKRQIGKIYIFKKPTEEKKNFLFSYLNNNHGMPVQHNTFPIVYKMGSFLGGSNELFEDMRNMLQ